MSSRSSNSSSDGLDMCLPMPARSLFIIGCCWTQFPFHGHLRVESSHHGRVVQAKPLAYPLSQESIKLDASFFNTFQQAVYVQLEIAKSFNEFHQLHLEEHLTAGQLWGRALSVRRSQTFAQVPSSTGAAWLCLGGGNSDNEYPTFFLYHNSGFRGIWHVVFFVEVYFDNFSGCSNAALWSSSASS